MNESFPRPDWDHWAFGIAAAVATRADCTRSHVGAVLLDHRKHVVMTGYNGVPAGHRGCLADACPRGRASFAEIPSGSDYSNCIALHAEENLMIHARREDLDGGTVYVTREPCYRCLPRLEAAGVTRVVWRDGTEASSETLRGDSPVQDAHPR